MNQYGWFFHFTCLKEMLDINIPSGAPLFLFNTPFSSLLLKAKFDESGMAHYRS